MPCQRGQQRAKFPWQKRSDRGAEAEAGRVTLLLIAGAREGAAFVSVRKNYYCPNEGGKAGIPVNGEGVSNDSAILVREKSMAENRKSELRQ